MLPTGGILVDGVDTLVLVLSAFMPFQVRISSEGDITNFSSGRIYQITSMFFFASSMFGSTWAESLTS